MALGLLINRIIEQRQYGRLLMYDIEKEKAEEKLEAQKNRQVRHVSGALRASTTTPIIAPAAERTTVSTIQFSRLQRQVLMLTFKRMTENDLGNRLRRMLCGVMERIVEMPRVMHGLCAHGLSFRY